MAIFVVGDKTLRRFGFADGASPSTNVPDPGFVPSPAAGGSSPTPPVLRLDPRPERPTTSGEMRALASFVTGRRTKWLVIAAWIVAVAALSPLGSKLADVTSDDTESFLPPRPSPPRC